MNIEEALEILREAILYEGCEAGDNWENLLYMYDRVDGDMFPAVYSAIRKTILEQAEEIQTKWTYVVDKNRSEILLDELFTLINEDNLDSDEFDKTVDELYKSVKSRGLGSKYLEYTG